MDRLNDFFIHYAQNIGVGFCLLLHEYDQLNWVFVKFLPIIM